MTIENVFRGALPAPYAPGRRLFVTQTVNAAGISPDFSATGNAAIFQYSFSGRTTSTGESDQNEVTRATSTVKVESPDDPNVYVEVKRIDSVTFANTGDPRKQHTLYFDNPEV